jgi:hypothetical protein
MNVGFVVRGYTHATAYSGRPVVGITLHNTEGMTPVTTYQSGGAWQRLIDRDGSVYHDVPDKMAAWHVERADRWRPDWVRTCPDGRVSDVNYCALGIELVSAQEARNANEPYTVWQVAALRRVVIDWYHAHGRLPVVGHGQMQADRSDPVQFDWAAAGFGAFVEGVGRFYDGGDPVRGPYTWPLRGTDPADPLRGGYNFLDWTDSGHTPHPGVDLNAGANCHDDKDLPVVCPAAGVVRHAERADATNGRGFGLHVWVEHASGEWGHFCHLDELAVHEGQQVGTGTVLGTCGNTDGWDCEHVHWEVMRGRPQAWDFWPYNWSQQQVAQRYFDPFTWLAVRGSLGMEHENMAILNDSELFEVVNKGWGELRGIPCNPDSGFYKAWVEALRAGDYRGLPVAGEMGVTFGTVQFFERGMVVWKNGADPSISWEG